jgi:hypothetical protein
MVDLSNGDEYPKKVTDGDTREFEFSARLLSRIFFGRKFGELGALQQQQLRGLRLKIPIALQCIAGQFVPEGKMGLLPLHLDEVQLLPAEAAEAIASGLRRWCEASGDSQPMAARHRLALVPILTGTRLDLEASTHFSTAFPIHSLLEHVEELSDDSVSKIVFRGLPSSMPRKTWEKSLASAIAAMGRNPRLLGCEWWIRQHYCGGN